MSNRGPIRISIGAEDAGKSLADIVAQQVGIAADVLDHGGAWIGRKRVFDGDSRLVLGDELTISRPPSGSYTQIAPTTLRIVYEDDDLLAIDKPAGTYVEATPWDVGGHLRQAAEQLLLARTGEPAYLHLAHRLDRDTSGVLLFSKNPAINPALQRSFAEGLVHKRYLCRCIGDFPATADDNQPMTNDEPGGSSVPGDVAYVTWTPDNKLELFTGHGRGAGGQFRVFAPEAIGQTLPNGATVKPMRTRFILLERSATSTLVQAEPTTGRTHQIRLHMAYLGCPILGDTKYGGPSTWNGETLPYHLLHAANLALRHPRSQTPLMIEAGAVWWSKER